MAVRETLCLATKKTGEKKTLREFNGEEAEAKSTSGFRKKKRKRKALFFLGGQTDQIIASETAQKGERDTSIYD